MGMRCDASARRSGVSPRRRVEQSGETDPREYRHGKNNPSETDETVAAHPPQASRRTADEIGKLDAYWRAANYLSVGQIYLRREEFLRGRPRRLAGRH